MVFISWPSFYLSTPKAHTITQYHAPRGWKGVSKISCIYCRISNGSSLAYTLTHNGTGLIWLGALLAPAPHFLNLPCDGVGAPLRAVCLMPMSVHCCWDHGVTKALQIFLFFIEERFIAVGKEKVRRQAKWVVQDRTVLRFVSDWGREEKRCRAFVK